MHGRPARRHVSQRPLLPSHVTTLLRAWSDGDAAAFDALVPLVYDELRLLARQYLRRERHAVSLQPTMLVHEAYLRLVDIRQLQWRDRAHFLGVSARVMRRVLVDLARARGSLKRGGGLADLNATRHGVTGSHTTPARSGRSVPSTWSPSPETVHLCTECGPELERYSMVRRKHRSDATPQPQFTQLPSCNLAIRNRPGNGQRPLDRGRPARAHDQRRHWPGVGLVVVVAVERPGLAGVQSIHLK
jgi:DNA-directed RNA polymerase specialized sigma24 family protein